MNPDFWTFLDELVASSTVTIDRPRHSTHPRNPGLIYPYDYGYLEGTTSGDGQGIDVWLGSGDHAQVTGIVCTVDLFKRDAELKVLLGCMAQDTAIISAFLNGTERLRGLAVPRPDAYAGASA
jgi:inorganic pyrophosphatase